MLLTDWQKFVCVNLFGFFRKGTDIRRFNEALIFLPRKQGKTSFSAALAEAKSILDRGSGAEDIHRCELCKADHGKFWIFGG